MALSAIGRKALMPHGAQRKIARQLGVEESRVSAAVNGTGLPITELGWKSYRRTQRAIARVLGLSLREAFQPHELGDVLQEQQEEITAA
jgi:DNA-binding transcriptional regulator YdaS (Cro superfamily)